MLILVTPSLQDDDDVDTGQILFNDGDDDAEELRSIRSSKVRWAIGVNIDKNRADEEALLGDPEGGAELVVVDTVKQTELDV
jgi:hypothetical protein